MTLKSIVERLAFLVEIEVIVDDCGNIAGIYNDMNHINEYLDCEVETIDTIEDGSLIVTVNGNTEE